MSGMKLYELNSMLMEAVTIAEAQAFDDGVIDNNWSAFLDDLEMAREEKILNVARYIKNLEAEAYALKTEKDRIDARQKTAQNQVASRKQYLMHNLNEKEKIADETASVSIRNNAPAVKLSDNFDCPEQFQRVKIEPDKTAIKNALKDGVKVKGAMLVKSQSVTIK